MNEISSPRYYALCITDPNGLILNFECVNGRLVTSGNLGLDPAAKLFFDAWKKEAQGFINEAVKEASDAALNNQRRGTDA